MTHSFKIQNLDNGRYVNLNPNEYEIIISSLLFIGSGAKDDLLDSILIENRKVNRNMYETFLKNKNLGELSLSYDHISIMIKAITKIIEIDEFSAITSNSLGFNNNSNGVDLIEKLKTLK